MNAQNPFPAPATSSGYQQIATTCGENDQVQLFTGNLVKTITVVNVPTIGLPLSFVLTYNSLDTVNGVVGNKFRHSYMMGLSGNFTSQITLTDATGRQYSFIYSGGSWVPDGSVASPTTNSYFYPATLTQSGFDWNLTFLNNGRYVFNNTGQLIAQYDGFGNETTLQYNAYSQLVSITEPMGRQVLLTYTSTSSSGLLETITDPNGNQTVLSYSGTNLYEILKPNGCVTYLFWTLLSTYGQYMLTSRQDASGTYTYGYQNIASTQPYAGSLISVMDAESPSMRVRLRQLSHT